MTDSVVIVGAGHGGVQTAATLRRFGFSGAVTLVDRSHEFPYERPPLSKAFVVGAAQASGLLQRKETFYAAKDISLRLGADIDMIDRTAARVVFADGSDLGYDALVLATGGRPRTIPVPGRGLDGILQLSTLDQAVELRERLRSAQHVVVVGAGYIGLEVASAAAKLGKTVRVLERADRVMSRVTGPIVSHYFEGVHRAQGVEIILNCEVEGFTGRGRVEYVTTRSGDSYPADLVVVGIGIQPAQELAVEAGLACDDGILVDAACRTSDPSIFAIGDVARHDNLQVGKQLRLECVQNAVDQATVAAGVIAGRELLYDEVPWFWTEQHGQRLQSAGLREDGDAEGLRGDPDSGHFTVLYLRGGKVAALDTVNLLKDFMPGKRLIANELSAPEGWEDPAVPLSNRSKGSSYGV